MFPLRRFWLRATGVSLAIGLFFSASAGATTIDSLRASLNLTPGQLLRVCGDFKFKLGVAVQPPAVFLANQAGDCDDFAALAQEVLRARGYTPRLVVVFMKRNTHVVCYVPQVKAYLDYNRRGCAQPLVPTDGSLRDIAARVASSFHEECFSVSEFTYRGGERCIGATEFP